jgi:hypothetical protein
VSLNLGAVVYHDHDLTTDPAPLDALLRRLGDAPGSTPGLLAWSARERSSTKPAPYDRDKLVEVVRQSDTVTVGVETPDRSLALIASTGAPDNSLPRAWRHDLVLALSAAHVASLGQELVIRALCDFASEVDVKAGVALWSPSLSFARALAFLASGSDLTKEQASRVTDAYYWRRQWGEVIRGPEWGTFLSAAHVTKLAGRALSAAQVIPLSSGGAFVQATAEPFAVETPPPALDALRDTLAPVLPL